VAGVPIALPRVLVETVSAGGGSIAWIDDGGALRVGPRSAGAVPGPVAFGRGGTVPTVTDAHIALGRLDAAQLSGGVRINAEAARAAIADLAERLGTDATRTASAIIAIADAEMARALRRVSVERGIDPRSCALLAFGGGGPLHACALADLLGMRTILVPPHAGVLSALGLAIAPERREAAASVMQLALSITGLDWPALLKRLVVEAGPVGSAEHRAQWTARVRYAGQGHELDVTTTPDDDGIMLAERFSALHHTRYGFILDRPVEVVAVRVAVSGTPVPVQFAPPAPSQHEVPGPAVVTLPDATMVVADAWVARPLPVGGWLLERV
jgi:N-methylhydantoinase A/oxoprolinase/acetone carboxylase beta subunit